jgi:Alternative complex III, ActD subunit
MAEKSGILASYEYLDSTVDAIERLRKEKFEVKAYSPYPDHHIEHALGYDQSPVRVWTLVGGLTGTATALAFTTWTSMDWPLVVGGKPIVSIPAYIIIMFELTVLFGALSTIIGLFVISKLPNFRPAIIYDPEFTAGRYGVYVETTADRLDEARRILQAQEPLELREGVLAHA